MIEMEEKHGYVPRKWCELSHKDKAAYATAIASFTLGWVITFVGLFLPPAGEVSPSVLTVFGTALVYAGGILGVSMYIKGSKAELYDTLEGKLAKRIDEAVAKQINER